LGGGGESQEYWGRRVLGHPSGSWGGNLTGFGVEVGAGFVVVYGDHSLGKRVGGGWVRRWTGSEGEDRMGIPGTQGIGGMILEILGSLAPWY